MTDGERRITYAKEEMGLRFMLPFSSRSGSSSSIFSFRIRCGLVSGICGATRTIHRWGRFCVREAWRCRHRNSLGAWYHRLSFADATAAFNLAHGRVQCRCQCGPQQVVGLRQTSCWYNTVRLPREAKRETCPHVCTTGRRRRRRRRRERDCARRGRSLAGVTRPTQATVSRLINLDSAAST